MFYKYILFLLFLKAINYLNKSVLFFVMIEIDLKRYNVLLQNLDENEGENPKVRVWGEGLRYLLSEFNQFQLKIESRILFIRKHFLKDQEVHIVNLPKGEIDLVKICEEEGYKLINLYGLEGLEG